MSDEPTEGVDYLFSDPHPVKAACIHIKGCGCAEAATQIRDLLEEREELLTEIRRLRMGNHPAGRALSPVEDHRRLQVVALREALTERDAEHEGGEGA